MAFNRSRFMHMKNSLEELKINHSDLCRAGWHWRPSGHNAHLLVSKHLDSELGNASVMQAQSS